MASTDFSKAVVKGLRQRGFSSRDICRMAGLSESTLKLITKGTARLKSSHLDRIEGALDVTTSRLAAESIGPIDPAFDKLLNSFEGLMRVLREDAPRRPARAKTTSKV